MTTSPARDELDKKQIANELLDGKADTGIDWCDWGGWYGDGTCDQFCLRPDPDCASDPLGPTPTGTPTRYPIVLIHGFGVDASSPVGSFWKVADALRADGHAVAEANLPPFDAPPVRAPVLARQIDDLLARTGAAKVNIIAHSQGGLDARYLISRLGYGDRVASLTTISTPHRGSAIADVILGWLPGNATQMSGAARNLFGGDLRAGLAALSEHASAAFNASVTDDPRVAYRSWAGVSSPTGIADVDLTPCEGKLLLRERSMDKLPLLIPKFVWTIVGHGERKDANDGLVTVTSAKWGEFQGCIPADHVDELGQFQKTFDPATGWDHLRFYRNIAFELGRAGS